MAHVDMKIQNHHVWSKDSVWNIFQKKFAAEHQSMKIKFSFTGGEMMVDMVLKIKLSLIIDLLFHIIWIHLYVTKGIQMLNGVNDQISF